MTIQIYKKYGYRLIPGSKHYLINKKGLVWNAKYTRPLKWVDNGKFYYYVQINGKKRLIHRSVYEAFIGPIPKGMEIHHKDANTFNNNLSNIEVVTKAYNLAQRFK